MPTGANRSKPYLLSQKGVDVVLEEIFWIGGGAPGRHLRVPPGVEVTLKHEMSFPPFFWQTRLSEGYHSFQINQFWNKFKVRLEKGGPATVVWVLG